MAKLSGKTGSVVVAGVSIAGINKWMLEASADALRSSGFDSGGHHDSGIGIDAWKGSFSGFKDGVPLTIGSIVTLKLREASTSVGLAFQGSAVIISRKHEVAYEGAVQYAYDFLGSGLLTQATVGDVAVSDNLLSSDDDEEAPSWTVYTKVRSIVTPGPGTLRIKFDIRTNLATQPAYGKIYRNGGAVGTERINTTVTYVTYSEDILGWSAGDTVELWVHIDVSGYAVYTRNFRIYGDIY